MTSVTAPVRAPARVPVFEARPSAPSGQLVMVAIPALNEEHSIGDVIHDVRLQGFECVVVDDGSSDRTGRVARRAGAVVLRHLVPLGQGAAPQTAIDWSLGNGADVIVTFDADGQHRATDIQQLLDALKRHDVDFALGSRFLGSTVGLSRNRRLLLKAAVRFTRLTTGMDVTDTHNGLRAMTKRGAACIHLQHDSMAHASEILHQIAKSRLHWVEVPVTIEYNEYTVGKGQSSVGFVAILVDLLMAGLQR